MDQLPPPLPPPLNVRAKPSDVEAAIRRFAAMTLAPEETIVTMIINGKDALDRHGSTLYRAGHVSTGGVMDVEDAVKEFADARVRSACIRRMSCTYEMCHGCAVFV